MGEIAGRVRHERERRAWTLAQLAAASGVSTAMISRIERGESSPTAVILGKLSGAFQLSIAELLTTDAPAPAAPRVWSDPETGYLRRQITAPGFPAEVAEILLPPGARVPYPAAAFAFIRQTIWVLEGNLTFHDGDRVHDLGPGDTLELGEPATRTFENKTETTCRYVVVLTRSPTP